MRGRRLVLLYTRITMTASPKTGGAKMKAASRESTATASSSSTQRNLKYRVALATAVVAVAAAAYVQFREFLTLQALAAQKQTVERIIMTNPVASHLGYNFLMAILIGFNIPGATFLSLCGGFFFEQPYAALLAYVGYLVGASISYTLMRFIFADSVQEYLSKNSAMFDKFASGLREAENFWETVSFLIFIRYVACFPFWFVNASCACLNIGYGYFCLTTGLATVPGALIYTLTGRLLADGFDRIDPNAETGDVVKELLWKAVTEDKSAQAVMALLGLCSVLPLLLRAPKWIRSWRDGKKAAAAAEAVKDKDAKPGSPKKSKSPKPTAANADTQKKAKSPAMKKSPAKNRQKSRNASSGRKRK